MNKVSGHIIKGEHYDITVKSPKIRTPQMFSVIVLKLEKKWV